MDQDEDWRRPKFHLSRVFIQWAQNLAVGAIVIYANFAVMQSQVQDLKTQVYRLDEKVSEQNGKLIGLNAQVAAYLAQQTQLNTTMDARLTYLERQQNRLEYQHGPNSNNGMVDHGR